MARTINVEKQMLARAQYIKGVSILSIVKNLDITEQTFYIWRRKANSEGDNWEYYRALMKSPDIIEGIALDLYADFEILLGRIRELKLNREITISDIKEIYIAHETIIRSTRKISPFFDKRMMVLDVLNLLGDFTRDDYPNFFDIFKEIREPFGNFLLESGFFNK